MFDWLLVVVFFIEAIVFFLWGFNWRISVDVKSRKKRL